MVIMVTLLSGAAVVVFGIKAAGNDRGVIINRVIELGAAGATTFYWALAAAAGLFTLAGIVAGVQTATSRQRIAIADGMLTLPARRWASEEATIPIREIERMRMHTISGQRTLQLWHAGKRYSITGAKLPRKRDFDELLAAIEASA
jgi:hypothetical protein